jgi:S-adenosylmethionine synthetase
MQQHIRTAEAVTKAHPDKVCDQISDAILDACLAEDRRTRAAIEVVGGHGELWIVGELTTSATVDLPAIAARVYRDAGYTDELSIRSTVVRQSPEIAQGVDSEGAGDQGIMVGYATSATPELLPLEVVLARRLVEAMGARDGKAQVTVEEGVVRKVVTSVCSTPSFDAATFESAVRDTLTPYLETSLDAIWHKNPNGSWTIGGFAADTGLTGRKLAVDNYGPHVPIGGGCFSGKDATKVDRSAAYMARKLAVDYERRSGAKDVYVHLAYAIGVAEPLMATVTVDGRTERVTGYDLRPRTIIEQLDLTRPQFEETARYGHFGRGFAWDGVEK